MAIRELSYKLFNRSINASMYRQPLKAGRFENLADAFMNRLDGYTPVVLKAKGKVTGDALTPIINNNPEKGKIGSKFVNWVRTETKDYAQRKDILGFSGSLTSIYKDIATNKTLYKMHATKNFCFETVFKEGKPQVIAKLDKNRLLGDLPDFYTVYERQPSGKLEKIFSGARREFQLAQEKQGKDPFPFSNNAEQIWNGTAK